VSARYGRVLIIAAIAGNHAHKGAKNMPKLNTKSVTQSASAATAAAEAAEAAKRAADEAAAKEAAEAKAAADLAAAATSVANTALRERVTPIVEILAADEGFTTEVEQSLAAKDITMRGPCAYLVAIERLLTADMMASLPLPGSSDKDSNNPDKYTDLVNNKKVKASYYRDLAKALPAGAREQHIVNQCKMYDADNPDTEEEFKALNGQEIADKQRSADRRIGNLAELLRKAVRLHNKMQDIREKLPNVDIKLILIDGELYDSPQPILICDKDAPVNGEYVSADTVLGYRVDHAVKQGGNQYKAIKFSGGKQTETTTGVGAPGAGAGAGMAPHIKNVHKFFESLMEVVAYLKKPENNKGILARLAAAEDGDANLELLGDASVEIDALITGPMEEKYKRIKADRAAADKVKDMATATKGATK
jgi:hypothetical protein